MVRDNDGHVLIHYVSRSPQGAFAEAQALFLHPAEEQVSQLASVLAANKMGVVAHFYMDPEVSLPLIYVHMILNVALYV